MAVDIKPLFGGTDFVTDAQRETVEKAASVLKPMFNVVHSEDERPDGVLVAVYNSETWWGQELAYKLEVTPTGVVRSFEWDSEGNPNEWDWEDAMGLPVWQEITATGVTYEMEDPNA